MTRKALWGCVACVLFSMGAEAGSAEVEGKIGLVHGLYEKLEYEKALEQIQRTRRLSRSVDENIRLFLYEGALLAELNRPEEASVSFREGLSLAMLFSRKSGTLPIKVAPKIEECFTAVRSALEKSVSQDNAWAGVQLAKAEVLELRTGTWSPVTPLTLPRAGHTSVALRSNQLLVCGGSTPKSSATTDAQLYEPSLRKWGPVRAMASPRIHHTATMLSSGKVLVAGGRDGKEWLSSAEIYHPAKRTWSKAGSLHTPRSGHAAVLLPSGKVLVVGGEEAGMWLASAELYDPATNAWTLTRSMHTPRSEHTAVVMASGKVMVAGGRTSGTSLSSVEVYDPKTAAWTQAEPMLFDRWLHAAVGLPSGEVLVIGGHNDPQGAEIYDPVAGAWGMAKPLITGRVSHHTATLLRSGKVMVVGGFGGGTSLAKAEVYDLATDAWTALRSLSTPRGHHSATLLPGDKVLVVGGTMASEIVPPKACGSGS
ncbi:kelch repeat-containing protein [Stigmatella erecta]|uniref:Galactose oxidase, central domain n=1 Tax=Stigmatella erecta TaxID=83460 RepID=A0A1I0B7V6_9BACT|nr:kelch repeat-containing protein [Stigmatella erecta]SET02226.1 Galactose oxidase, central domain [Stigmatella erecta]